MIDFFLPEVTEDPYPYEDKVKKSLAKLELLKSSINNSQTMVSIVEEELQANIRYLKDGLFLARQSHNTDLIWIVGELRAILLSWGGDEVLNAITKERVQNLKSALSAKVGDV